MLLPRTLIAGTGQEMLEIIIKINYSINLNICDRDAPSEFDSEQLNAIKKELFKCVNKKKNAAKCALNVR